MEDHDLDQLSELKARLHNKISNTMIQKAQPQLSPSGRFRLPSAAKRRKIIMDSDDEMDNSSFITAVESMDPLPASPLTSLPTELLQHIMLWLLKPCLHDPELGERGFHGSVMALAGTSRTTRSNVIAVLRMIRKEIAVGGTLVNSCARPHEMRMLVLTMDYDLTNHSRIKVIIERYREVRWWDRGTEEEVRRKEKYRRRLREEQAALGYGSELEDD